MRTAICALISMVFLAGPAAADGLPVVAAFPLSGEADVSEHLPLVDQALRAEIRKSSAHLLLTQEKLGENLLMAPAENLAFCAGEAGCIADMGGEAGAQWILFGDLKWSFDHSKLLIRLVLVDVALRTQAAEAFGQVSPEKAAEKVSNLVREILGIPEPIPVPVVVAPVPAPKVAEISPPKQDPDPVGGELKPGSITAPAPPAAPAFWENPWTWTAAGVGLVSLAAASGLGMLSQKREDDALRLAATGQHPIADRKLMDAENYALGANVLFAVGGAGLAAAVVLIVLDLTAEPQVASPGVACGAAGCGASLSFRF